MRTSVLRGLAIAGLTSKEPERCPMADERRKGPPDTRRSRGAKPAHATEQSVKPTADEQAGGQDPNDVARFDAEQLDASIREREQEDRGEVL